MLKSLYIQNYALISNLAIDFNEGLSIITGETGAGKSILLGALSLILGQRADTSVLLDKSKKCIVETTFDIGGYNLEKAFNENDVDYEKNSIFRREINTNGKSRAFINDTPVNLNALKTIVLQLIDIHSQHQNLELSNHYFQLNVVDSVAQQKELLTNYKKTFIEYTNLKKQYNEIAQKANQTKSDTDYFQFQYNQLEEAKLTPGEQEELEKELDTLNHTEEIKTALSTAIHNLSGEGPTILNALREIKSLTEKITEFYPKADEITERLDSSYIELNDLAREVEMEAEKIEFSPERITYINERLDLIYGLEQKHRVKTIEELLKLKDDFQTKLNEINSFDEILKELEQKIKSAKDSILSQARILSENRKKIIPQIESTITELLKQLGIPNALFHITQNTIPEPSLHGMDDILFLFSANKHTDLQEVSKIASGGEISRLMLSLKSLLSSSSSLPTIIFDEIDSGVSGEIADKMGNIINNMSNKMQVINITHLPQVASKGKYHYLVYKTDNNNSTSTHVKLLNNNERINEIAKMLSGKELTEAALVNARELLSN